MPARRSTGNTGMSSSSPRSDDNEDAYKLKRKRNNDVSIRFVALISLKYLKNVYLCFSIKAVKRTREKSKQTAQQRKENVERLRKVNTQMETKIEEVKNNVEILKEILLHKVEPEKHDQIIKKILEEPTDDEDDD